MADEPEPPPWAKGPFCVDCKHSTNRDTDCMHPELARMSVVFRGVAFQRVMIRQVEARFAPSLCSLAGNWFEKKDG